MTNILRIVVYLYDLGLYSIANIDFSINDSLEILKNQTLGN